MNAFLVAVNSESPGKLLARLPGGDHARTWHNNSFAAYANGGVPSLNSELEINTTHGPIAFVGRLALNNRHLLERGKHDGELRDEELCLLLYKEHGIDFVRGVVGHYAFVVWDGRDNTLYCARDALGTVPLCYARGRSGNFFVASDARTILQTGAVDAAINEAKIADFLILLEGSDHVETFYANVNRLPPGQLLTYRDGQLTYAACDEIRPAEVSESISDNEAADLYREKLALAVGRCIGADHRVACTLSGGLDSAVVAFETKRISKNRGLPRLRTFSAKVGTRKFEAVSGEDSRFIDILVEHLGFDSQIVTPDDLSGPTVEEWCQDCDNLFDLHMGCIRTILTRAASQDFNTVLDGMEGDLIASMNVEYVNHLYQSGRWLRAMFESPLSFRRQQGAPLLRSARAGLHRFRAARNYSKTRKTPTTIEQRWPTTLINRDFARQVGLEDRFRAFQEAEPQLGSDIKRYHAATLGTSTLTAALERYDRVPRDVGICLRHPLLDRELVEFLVGCPWHLKNRWGWNKFLVRKAYKRQLTSNVAWRRTHDNMMPIFNLAGEEYLLMRGRELLPTNDVNNEIWRFVDRDRYALYSKNTTNFAENLNVLLATALAIWMNEA